MRKDYYAVIMAGGGGTRLWPVSRKARPKQTLALFEERSLFEIAVDRIKPIIPVERILVVTIAEQADQLQRLAPEIPVENYLLEPAPRGTASVIGLAAVHLTEKNPDAVMACLTADHFMRNEEYLRELLLAAYDAARDSYLVTLGITPDFPSTGYGYIHRGELAGLYNEKSAYKVLAFKEKPDQPTAVRYIKDGDFVWNSGMFIWKTDRILEELDKSMPELSSSLDTIRSAMGTGEAQEVLEAEWKRIVPETIDYGVMEKAEQVVVIPASDLGWVDIGSWDRFPELVAADENGNIVQAAHSRVLESRNSIIFQETARSKSGRFIAALGVQDLIVVDTDDILLVCHQSKANEVKRIVQELKEDGIDQYL